MTTSHVRTFGVEPDPAKRLRQRWGKEMRFTRKALGWSLELTAEKIRDLGYPITAQAISQWERGDTSPRHHLQVAWCRVTGRPHGEVFTYDDAAA